MIISTFPVIGGCPLSTKNPAEPFLNCSRPEEHAVFSESFQTIDNCYGDAFTVSFFGTLTTERVCHEKYLICQALFCYSSASSGWFGLLALSVPWSSQAAAPDNSPEVERARREVRLLDDIHKSAIVLITKHYVEEKSHLPAGEAFKVLFNNMKEKG
jgi:hypothetical protein